MILEGSTSFGNLLDMCTAELQLPAAAESEGAVGRRIRVFLRPDFEDPECLETPLKVQST